MTQQDFAQYIRHGQTPFFRLPLAPDDGNGNVIYPRCDVAVLGVPYDGGTTYRSGARLGPYHLRRVSALVGSFHPVHRIDVFSEVRVVDAGNVMSPPFNPGAMRELVQIEVAAMLAAGAIPAVVGGDHSVTLPVLRALAARHGEIALVHIDAHFDTSDDAAWGERYHHGTPIRNAIEEGLVARGKLFQVGLRGPWSSGDEAALGERHGAHRWTADGLASAGPYAVACRIVELAEGRPLYLSVDIDAVDPAFAPGTGTPVPGGLSARELLGFLRGLDGAKLCGMDLVEVTPMLDHADVTCLLGAHVLYEGIALAARARARG